MLCLIHAPTPTFANGANKTQRIRIKAIAGKSIRASTLQNKMTRQHGGTNIEIQLSPFESSVVEWE